MFASALEGLFTVLGPAIQAKSPANQRVSFQVSADSAFNKSNFLERQRLARKCPKKPDKFS